MRRFIVIPLLVLIVLCFVVAKPEIETRLSLKEGQSAEFNGKMITVLTMDAQQDKAIVCVNGEKAIISHDKVKQVDDATLSIRKIEDSRAEIDLIARKEQLLVFVEVKVRKSQAFGYPESFVSPTQRWLEAPIWILREIFRYSSR